MEFERLSGLEKAAVLTLALPEEAARALLGRLGDDEVARLLGAVARLDEVPGSVQERVLAEFREAVGQRRRVLVGGRRRAALLAREALEPSRAERVSGHLGADESRVDRRLARFSPGFVARSLAGEHPQTVALVLAQLPPERAAFVLAALPEALAADVVLRMATLEDVPADVLAELEEGVAALFDTRSGPSTPVGGVEVTARVLARIPRSAGLPLLAGVDERNPLVGEEIRRRMFRFDELRRLDRKSFQALLREVSIEDLVMALAAAGEEMREKVFENVSQRAGEQIQEDLELLGAVRRSDSEAVQQRIVDVARRLEEEGRLDLEAEAGPHVPA